MWIFVIETYYFWLVSLRKTYFKSHTSSKVRSITQGNMGDSLDILWSFNNTLQRDCCVCMFERLTCNVFLFTLNTIIIFLKVWNGHSKSQPLTNQSTWIPAFYFQFSHCRVRIWSHDLSIRMPLRPLLVSFIWFPAYSDWFRNGSLTLAWTNQKLLRLSCLPFSWGC